MSPVPAAALPTALEGTFLCVLSCPKAAAPPWSARALGLGKTAPYGARKGRATVREPQPEAEVQQFAESRGSEAPRPPRAQPRDRTPQWISGRVGPEETVAACREPRAAAESPTRTHLKNSKPRNPPRVAGRDPQNCGPSRGLASTRTRSASRFALFSNFASKRRV